MAALYSLAQLELASTSQGFNTGSKPWLRMKPYIKQMKTMHQKVMCLFSMLYASNV
jgi:hypothetical protein